MSAIPLADVLELLPAGRRTTLVRWVLTGALAASLVAAYLLAPDHDLERAFAAASRGTVIVLDQSGSINTDKNARLIGRQLLAEARTAGPHGHVGLVLFSDVSIEALPPVAPASALLSFRRFFVPLGKNSSARSKVLSGGGLSYPASPWNAFVGGTTISSGLREALADLHRAGMSGGTVLLVSDLVDSPLDSKAVKRVLLTYSHSRTLRLQVRVLPSGLFRPLRFYRRILGAAAVRSARVAPAPSPRVASRQPLSSWLLAAAVLAAVALALHELLAAPLRWRRLGSEAPA
jgi:hypothetical protein